MSDNLRRPKIRQCIYCLGEFPRAQITDDHIIAGSWYPATTPSTVQRWTAPACLDCNNHFSSIERYVHTRLAFCVDPTYPAAAGMWDNAKRSIDPKQAHGDRDRKQRALQRRAFQRDMTELQQLPPHTLPFSITNFEKGSRCGINIDANKINPLVEKWARGIHYRIHGRSVSPAGEITLIHIHEEDAATAFGCFWAQRECLDAGSGIQVTYLTTNDRSKRADVYLFRIWDQFEVFASVDDKIIIDHVGN